MRKIFAAIPTLLARFIAVLLATLTIVATILVLLLSSVDRTLLNAGTYKRAFSENQVYDQLPALLSQQLSTDQRLAADPCAEYPLVCAIEDASPELQTCLTKSLGMVALEDIGSGRRKPTAAETESTQLCLDRFAIASQPAFESGLANNSLLDGASEKARTCARQRLGDEIYTALANTERPATLAETQVIEMCIEESAAPPASAIPGLSDGQRALLKNLTPAQWDALIFHVLPPDDAQSMLESAFAELVSFFKGEADTARMPLAPLKAHLTGEAGETLITLLLDSQPTCTPEQQAQIEAGDFGDDEAPPILCAAEGDTLRKLTAELQRRLNDAASEIPEDAALIDPLPEIAPSGIWRLLGNDPQVVRQKIYTGIRFSPLFVLFLLLLLALFGVRSLRGCMRWWGIPIFIAGLITLGIGFAGLSRFDWAWERYAVPEIPSAVDSNLSEMGRQLTQALVNDLSKWMVLEAGMVVLVALAVLIGSFHVTPPPDPSLPPLRPPGTPGGPVLVRPISKRKGKRK
jgi:hypothetical protein